MWLNNSHKDDAINGWKLIRNINQVAVWRHTTCFHNIYALDLDPFHNSFLAHVDTLIHYTTCYSAIISFWKSHERPDHINMNPSKHFSMQNLTFCWPCIMQWFLVIVQLDAQILFNVFIYLFIVLYMFRACHAHHQEKQIVSIQLLVIVTPCWWQCRVLVD